MIRGNEATVPRRGTIIMDISALLRLADILSDGFETDEVFSSKKRWVPTSLSELIKLAAKGRLENIHVKHDGVTEADVALEKVTTDVAAGPYYVGEGARGNAADMRERVRQYQRRKLMNFNDHYSVNEIGYNDRSVEELIGQYPQAILWTEKIMQSNAARGLGAKVVNTNGVLSALEQQGLLAHLGLKDDVSGLIASMQIANDRLVGATRTIDTRRIDGEGVTGGNTLPFQQSLEGIREALDAEQAEKTARAAVSTGRMDKFKEKFNVAQLIKDQAKRDRGSR